MTNGLLYAITALALASVFVFDENFSSNLARVIGEPIAAMPLNMWEVGMAGVLAALIVAAFFRERPRR